MFGSLLAAILGEERLREEREAPLPLRITPEDGWELRRCSLGVDWVRTSWGRGALDLQKKTNEMGIAIELPVSPAPPALSV